MAILRSDEIRGMNDSEVDERLLQLKKELMKINGVLASGGIPEEVGKVREIRKTIARINTIASQQKDNKKTISSQEKNNKKTKSKKPAKEVKNKK
jgi:large subunit ribosomal protein L29